MDKYAKAIIGAVTAALGALATALMDGHLSPVEGVGVAAAALGALALVWGVPNKQA